MMNAIINKLKNVLFGKPKNPLDKKVFHSLALTAFFAWVGLGADGISSSCYGPEEAFLALGTHQYLGIFLAILICLVVFIISISYSQVIEVFPNGGGGYVVASKLIHPRVGVVAGSALVVDYILTIAISVASGIDAIFSFIPPQYLHYKMTAKILIITFLLILNLRGVKESVMALLPIFILFVVMHIGLIVSGVMIHAADVPAMVQQSVDSTAHAIQTEGLFFVLLIFFKAFSMGGGTFTGIEAVSDGLLALKEPRVETGKKTMMYMAVSLSFLAGGILLNYALFQVHHVPGKTLNSVLIENIIGRFSLIPEQIRTGLIILMLLSEGAILFVAAQTGFLDGPRVMSNMANDSWLPHKFSMLSDRLVIKNGIVFMGLSALVMVILTKGEVSKLVVMYSINVFITFSLSQFGMVRHWLSKRGTSENWHLKLFWNAFGLMVASSILVIIISLKFTEGGWITICITSIFVFICFYINKHYRMTQEKFANLDAVLATLKVDRCDIESKPVKTQPTAIFLVTEFNGLGVHTILQVQKLFPFHFKNFIFISSGVIDTNKFKGVEEIEQLKGYVNDELQKYVNFVKLNMCAHAEGRSVYGVDKIENIYTECRKIYAEYPRSIVFCGRLIFQDENFLTRQLHNQFAYTIQRKLNFEGMNVIIMPIRVY